MHLKFFLMILSFFLSAAQLFCSRSPTRDWSGQSSFKVRPCMHRANTFAEFFFRVGSLSFL